MAIPSIILTGGCGKLPEPKIDDKGKPNLGAKIILAASAADIVLTISTIVVGLLGILGVIGMPPAAAYALFAVAGALIISHVITAILTKGESIMVLKEFIQEMCTRGCGKDDKAQVQGNKQ